MYLLTFANGVASVSSNALKRTVLSNLNDKMKQMMDENSLDNSLLDQLMQPTYKNTTMEQIMNDVAGFKNATVEQMTAILPGFKNATLEQMMNDAMGFKNATTEQMVNELLGFKNATTGDLLSFKNATMEQMMNEFSALENATMEQMADAFPGFKNATMEQMLNDFSPLKDATKEITNALPGFKNATLSQLLSDVDMATDGTLKQLSSMGDECVKETVILHGEDGTLQTSAEEYFSSLVPLEKQVKWSLDPKGAPKAEATFDFTNTFSDSLFKDYEQSCFSSGGMMCYFNIGLTGEILVHALTSFGVNFNGTAAPGCASKTCSGVDVSNITNVGIPKAFAEKFGISLENLAYHVNVDKCDY